ncbi:hypothetical protein GX51_03500 [Blastomyces parvus]|uniref:F-box domain-containing protein n=1 Tax=Blastomyces parvus TaxID=2060905 RepID=A0A2B7X771_9EURO|nr:hypothetical protein GX51_03500 [Blastomyces parvus]
MTDSNVTEKKKISLLDLPTELLMLVMENVPSKRALNLVTRANRRFHSIGNPILYRKDAKIYALQWAAKNGKEATAKRALFFGADPRKRRQKTSSLDIAIREKRWEMVKLLLAAKTEEKIDDHLRLRKAAAWGRAELTQILLDHGGIDLSDPSHDVIGSLKDALWQFQGKTAAMIVDKYRKEGLEITDGSPILSEAVLLFLTDLVKSLNKADVRRS